MFSQATSRRRTAEATARFGSWKNGAMPSVGIVLGAGGVVGAAYHAGVLTALAEVGFDARDADLIVGTSAGSAVAASLRAGFPPIDLAPRNLGEPISDEAQAIVGRTGGPPAIDLRPRPFSRTPRPASPKLLLTSARHPAKVLAGLLPTGTIPTDVIGERISMMYGARSWPEQRLWICAVDLEDGARVVFGRDTPPRRTHPSALRCRHRRRSPGSSDRSSTQVGATSTAVSTRPPTPTCSPMRGSTSW